MWWQQLTNKKTRAALHILASVANWAAVKLKYINFKLCNFRIWTLRRHKGHRAVLLQRRPHSQMRSLQGLVKLEIKLVRTASVTALPPNFSLIIDAGLRYYSVVSMLSSKTK